MTTRCNGVKKASHRLLFVGLNFFNPQSLPREKQARAEQMKLLASSLFFLLIFLYRSGNQSGDVQFFAVAMSGLVVLYNAKLIVNTKFFHKLLRKLTYF